ncbi:hypothetical protein T05_5885 [Trichinella murrelli]|uniref:Uncharacterized protein n=1 Tax=Trichinella murrelli TaxID=144512 RepID=A0A0V0SVB7_9BILA|nr:hypothetical protein T05_5885 [Trichinella murrelli]
MGATKASHSFSLGLAFEFSALRSRVITDGRKFGLHLPKGTNKNWCTEESVTPSSR